MNEPNIRGVSVVTFSGKEITLKASFAALTSIEATLKTDLLTVAKDVAASKLSITTLAVCLLELSKAGGHKFTLAQCGQMILDKGMIKAAAPIMTSLGAAIVAGDEEVAPKEDAEDGSPS